jgi:hypothetical protein
MTSQRKAVVFFDQYQNHFRALVYKISDKTVERLLRNGGKTFDLLILRTWILRFLNEDKSDDYETRHDNSSPIF